MQVRILLGTIWGSAVFIGTPRFLLVFIGVSDLYFILCGNMLYRVGIEILSMNLSTQKITNLIAHFGLGFIHVHCVLVDGFHYIVGFPAAHFIRGRAGYLRHLLS